MSERPLTLHRLKRLLHYDHVTGVFTWKYDIKGHIKAGAIAGSTNGCGYIAIGIDSKLYRANILAWFYMTGVWPDLFVDHKNRNKQDNSFSNLQLLNNAENKRNGNLYKNNTSGYKGVYKSRTPGKWTSMVRYNGSAICLGTFRSAEAASRAFENYTKTQLGY